MYKTDKNGDLHFEYLSF